MAPEDVDPEPVDVWPENWPALQLFVRCSRQWRFGMNGPTGLDFLLPLKLMDSMNLSETAYDELLDALVIMEAAAIEEMRKE